MSQEHQDIADRLRRVQAEMRTIQAEMDDVAVDMVCEACERAGSLRALARATGLSPTFLSQARNGLIRVHPPAFLNIANTMKGLPA